LIRVPAFRNRERGSVRRRIVRQALAWICIGIVFTSGCSKQPALSPKGAAQAPSLKPLSAPPEITSETEEGFHDLIFHASSYKRYSDGSQTVHGTAVHNDRKLGLEIKLGPGWQAGSLGKDIPLVTYRGNISYRTTGSESDVLLGLIDQLYGTKIDPKRMGKETHFTGISLGGDPRDLTKGPVKIKLFYETSDQRDYAELFTNFDLATHRLGISEKDEEYRSAIVRALRAR